MTLPVSEDVVRTGRRVRRRLLGLHMLAMTAMELTGPFWPAHWGIGSESAASTAWAGVLVYVLPMLGVMMTVRFWGRMADRIGPKWMLLRALAGLTASQALLACTDDMIAVLAIRLLQGLCGGSIAMVQIYGAMSGTDRFSKMSPGASFDSPARWFSAVQAATHIGAMLGALAGGALFAVLPFSWLNGLAAGLCALAFLWAMTLARPAARPRLEAGSDTFAGAPATRTPLCVLGLVTMARSMPRMAMPVYIAQILHGSPALVGYCTAALSGGLLLASTWRVRHERRCAMQSLARFIGGTQIGMRWHLWQLSPAPTPPTPPTVPTFTRDPAASVRRSAYVCAGIVLALALVRTPAAYVGLHLIWGGVGGLFSPALLAWICMGATSSKSCKQVRVRNVATLDLPFGRVLGVPQSVTQAASIAGFGCGGLLVSLHSIGYLYGVIAALYLLAAVGLRGRGT